MKLTCDETGIFRVLIPTNELNALILTICETMKHLEDDLFTRTGYNESEFNALLEKLRESLWCQETHDSKIEETSVKSNGCELELLFNRTELTILEQGLVEILYGFEFDFDNNPEFSEKKLEEIFVTIEKVLNETENDFGGDLNSVTLRN